MSGAGERQAVVTGIGVIAPNGTGTESWWNATVAGRSGVRRIERFDPSTYPVHLAGEIAGFDPSDAIDWRTLAQTDRGTQLALVAAAMALQDAGLDPTTADPQRMSVVTASSSGGNEFREQELQHLWSSGAIFVGAYGSIAPIHAATTGQLSIRLGIKGPPGVVVAEGAGGLAALQQARRAVRRGVEVVVSGGIEAPITPNALTCQLPTGLLSREREPGAAYRPFDARANGYVPAEGGAMLIVEDLETARRRGAHIYGEIAGYGATNDAYHHSRAAPDGRQFARAISLAMQSAGVGPEEVDAIIADAAGTLEGDALECAAIEQALGGRAHTVPVTAPKSMVGRLSSGGGPLDVAAALLAMRNGCLPPTVNLDEPAPGCALRMVRGSAQEAQLRTVLVNARGFAGFNSAMILRTVAEVQCAG